MKRYWLIASLVLAAVLLSWFIPNPGQPLDAKALALLPWSIEVLPNGNSKIFGVRLGEANLGDLQQILGDDMELAIVAGPDEIGELEAYYSHLLLGYIQARMIVTVDVPKEQIIRMRERAPKAEYMESATRKIRLHPEDSTAARLLPIRALAVIPAANLDEAAIVERFGPPGELLQVSVARRHLLYPEKGLDIVLDREGKELLQYVPPRHFSILREPLRENTESSVTK